MVVYRLLGERGKGRCVLKQKVDCYRLMQSTAGLGIRWMHVWNPEWPMERLIIVGFVMGGFGVDVDHPQKKESACERKADRCTAVSECMLALVPARVTVRNKARQGITDSLLERVKAADGMCMWRRRAGSHFLCPASKGTGYGRNNDSNTWVSGYRMQSAEFKQAG